MITTMPTEFQEPLEENAILSVVKYLFQRNQVSKTAQDVLIDEVAKELFQVKATLSMFINNDKDCRAIYECMKKLYPTIKDEDLTKYLLSDESVNRAIDESILNEMISAWGISLQSLVDHPELYQQLVTFLSKKHPNYELDRDMSQELLEGKWAEEIEAALNEPSVQSSETIRPTIPKRGAK